MKYRDVLIELYNEAIVEEGYSASLTMQTSSNIDILANNCFNQKGVYTVFITLAIYKIIHKEQDIRRHQTQIESGFSGRSIDTKYITPTLKELGLPSMAESGWLTRSLEQPYPYTLDYEGKIGNLEVKKSFLELIDDIETKRIKSEYILVELFKKIIAIQAENNIAINPLKNPEKVTISNLINILNKQFSINYKSFGGSKLPVLAFFAIYKILINELSRYKDCELNDIGSHTASDRTSKTAGDIEIFLDKQLFEAIEIKLDKPIDSNILRIAKEKIEKFNPNRYYILSYFEILEDDKVEVNKIIQEVKKLHGCQIVANGLMPTLKYYFRLISNLEEFVTIYSNLIENDSELKTIHKTTWNELLVELEDEL